MGHVLATSQKGRKRGAPTIGAPQFGPRPAGTPAFLTEYHVPAPIISTSQNRNKYPQPRSSPMADVSSGSSEPPTKKRRGRPPGQTNKPTARNVGRPRKDGTPAQPRRATSGSSAGKRVTTACNTSRASTEAASSRSASIFSTPRRNPELGQVQHNAVHTPSLSGDRESGKEVQTPMTTEGTQVISRASADVPTNVVQENHGAPISGHQKPENETTPPSATAATVDCGNAVDSPDILPRRDDLDVGSTGDDDADRVVVTDEVTGMASSVRDTDETEMAETSGQSPESVYFATASESQDSSPHDEQDSWFRSGDDSDNDDADVPFLFNAPDDLVEEDEFDDIPDDTDADAADPPPVPTAASHTASSGRSRVAPTGSLNAFSFLSKKKSAANPDVRQHRSSMPTWIKANYEDAKEQIKLEMRTNPSRKPTCYANKTFYFKPTPPFFTCREKYQPLPQFFYDVQYFLWLPHLLQPEGIFCPQCTASGRKTKKGEPVVLHGYGWAKAPRRVRGVGPEPFADMIRTNHIRRYEKLHLLYLEFIYRKLHSPFSEKLSGFVPFPTFSDRTGYAGFTPSPNYFRDFYINMTRARATEMDQVTAMLVSARILCIDHSFKVIKHIAKINGISVVGAMYGGVNEYGEIRILLLTEGKAHAQYMPAMQAVSESLKTYGHDPIELIFTDNPRADKPELERAFPSLLKDVVPVPDASSLEPLSIPPQFTPIDLLESAFRVTSRCAEIIQRIPPNGDFYVAMDMEWPVDPDTHMQGLVSVISIAYHQGLYVIPLHSYADKRNGRLNLPNQLLNLLRSHRVKKVGAQVSGDLARLYRDCGFSAETDQPFVGAVNLGPYAKERNAVTRANLGLADLTAAVVKRYLPKDPAIRVSSSWANSSLTSDQVTYAALDAFASWSVFIALQSVAIGQPVTAETRGGAPVSLLSNDHSRIVAEGHIALDRPDKFEGVNLTKTRVLVTITSVLVPGHLILGELQASKEARALSDFPNPPFNVVLRATHVRTRYDAKTDLSTLSAHQLDPDTANIAPSNTVLETVDTSAETRTPPRSTADLNQSDQISQELDAPLSSAAMPLEANDDLLSSAAQALSDSSSSDTSGSSQPRWCDDADRVEANEQNPTTSTADANGFATAASLTAQHSRAPSGSENHVTRSRVLGDIWHLMNQFPISMRHGLRRPFARAFRDAMFLPDPEDKAAVEAILNAHNVTWENMVRYHSTWIWRRVRRYVPAAEELLPRVLLILSTFGPLKDAKTGEPLFNEEAWKIASNVLENIRRGLYSDPPGVQLYFIRNKDRFGLTRYRCIRGTNGIEGGFHQNVIRIFDVFNASPEFAVELFRDYVFHHNLRVGTLNRTGRRYEGSYDVSTRNRITHLLNQLSTKFERPPVGFGLGGWVNGNDYTRSKEVIGILPLPQATKTSLDMLNYNAAFAKKAAVRHRELALRQGTQYAVLPIHTAAERALFRCMITQLGENDQSRAPNWQALATRWSGHCDGRTIFYKLPEHLRAHWKSWMDIVNEKSSVSISQAAYDEMRTALVPSMTNFNSIPAAHGVPLPKQVLPATASVERGEPVTSWQIRGLLDKQSLAQTAVTLDFFEHPNSHRVPLQPSRAKKRSHAEGPGNEAGPSSKEGGRKERACPKCQEIECEGRYNSRPCAPDLKAIRKREARERAVASMRS
ncbi:hypothetical protein EIP91_008291 [Steccherinum ochraceum]|uniref:3'-5' exonuclease n=1 Tax=Steccherinum ochraceum TaxID=92696 RepID=A0A4R0R315_9APHY|nr:hypothetical protein EIP91_008291 [Steccherinum ochraceum]